MLDMAIAGTPPSLLLFTHEDRPLDRAHLSVEGLDSGVIVLRGRPGDGGRVAPTTFEDPGPGKRTFVNLGERATPVIELAAAASDDGSMLAVVGAGSDNLLVAPRADLAAATVVEVGANPSAVAALPGGRFVTADRLSDSLTFVAEGRVTATLDVGAPARMSIADRGELLFYSRALVPHNVADGPLSLYTCAACHDDGHVDGRRHPAKRNRFSSMTKSCRALGTTAPYLSIGEPATIEGFADNIVTTHAQGAERGAEGFDKYPVTLRVRAGSGWERVTLSPEELRAALTAYMVRIPPEPSPYVARGRRALDRVERGGPGRVPRRLRRLSSAGRRFGHGRADPAAPARRAVARGRGRAHEPAAARGRDADAGGRRQQPAVAARGVGGGALLQRRQCADIGRGAAPDRPRCAEGARCGERRAPAGVH